MCFKTHFANSKSPRKIILDKKHFFDSKSFRFQKILAPKIAFQTVIFVKKSEFSNKKRIRLWVHYHCSTRHLFSTKNSLIFGIFERRKEQKCPKFFVNSKIMIFVNLRKEIGRSIIDRIGHLLIKKGHFRSKIRHCHSVEPNS